MNVSNCPVCGNCLQRRKVPHLRQLRLVEMQRSLIPFAGTPSAY